MYVDGGGCSGFTSLNSSVLVLLFSSGAEYCLEFVILYIKKQRIAAEICGTMSVRLRWKHSESSTPRIFCIGQYSKDYGIWQGSLAIIAVHRMVRSVL